MLATLSSPESFWTSRRAGIADHMKHQLSGILDLLDRSRAEDVGQVHRRIVSVHGPRYRLGYQALVDLRDEGREPVLLVVIRLERSVVGIFPRVGIGKNEAAVRNRRAAAGQWHVTRKNRSRYGRARAGTAQDAGARQFGADAWRDRSLGVQFGNPGVEGTSKSVRLVVLIGEFHEQGGNLSVGEKEQIWPRPDWARFRGSGRRSAPRSGKSCPDSCGRCRCR